MKYKFGDIIYNITEKRKPTEEDRLNYIGLEHLDSGSLFVTRWGAERTPEGEKIVMKKGDVLFGKRRAYQKKVAISPIDGVFSAHGMVLRPKENVICKEFLPFFISSDYFLNEAIRISVGGLSPTINWKDIKELEFNLPSIDEQIVLAEKLWAAYEVKQSYLKMIEATDEMVKTQFIEMFGNPVEIQESDIETTIQDYVDVISGFPFDSSLFTDDSNYTPLIRIRDVVRGWTETYTSEKFDDIYLIRKDDLIVGMDGMFEIARWKSETAALNQRVCTLRPKNDIKKYVIEYYVQPILKKIEGNTNATTVKHISTKQINNIKIPFYNNYIQSRFSRIAEQAEKSKSEIRKSIEAIDKVIKSLINENL